LSASQLAGLMRGVQSDEIAGFVNELNASYKENSQALFIADVEGGFRMQLAPHMHEVRARMHGKIKEARLNQDAIDCLALVAYQPGIERRHLEQQVSRKMDGVINMLVRRDMIRLERKPVKGQPAERRYFPTDRMLNLFGLESLDELPHVGDLD
jgi:chromosome segregation and condensation protein ScpB